MRVSNKVATCNFSICSLDTDRTLRMAEKSCDACPAVARLSGTVRRRAQAMAIYALRHLAHRGDATVITTLLAVTEGYLRAPV